MRVHVTERNDTNTYVYITVVDNEINVNRNLRYLLKCLEVGARGFILKVSYGSDDQSFKCV